MNRYPTAISSYTQLLKQSFRLHYLTLKHTIFFIILLIAVKYFSVVLSLFITSRIILDSFYFIATLLAIYLASGALLAAHESFMDRSKSFVDIFSEVKKNIVNIYATFFLYIAGSVAMWYVARFFNLAIEKILAHEFSAVHGFAFIISLTLIIIFAAMFFFSYPLSVIDSKQIHKTFYNSLVLSDKSKFGIFVLFFILMAIDVLISPTSLEEHFLSTYHLGMVFDFVVLSVMLPLFINLLLLTIHDAKLQMSEEEG